MSALMTPKPEEGERDVDYALRPKSFADYIGQRKITESISIYAQAAKQRGEALDHVLLGGPPGLGKTSLAHVIANEMGARILVAHGPAIVHRGALASFLTQIGENDVLFIDEIHRVPKGIEECLYPAMEDYKMEVVIGDKSQSLPLPKFTLIGATTRTGLLSAPLRDRFGIVERLDYYEAADLGTIAARSARLLGIGLEGTAAVEIGSRARGTPRIVNRLLRRVRDKGQVAGLDTVTRDFAAKTLDWLGVDAKGLDEPCRRILRTIVEKFGGGPAGIESIAAACGEDKGTVEDEYEPYLIQQGFIARTPRGRTALKLAYTHLNLRG